MSSSVTLDPAWSANVDNNFHPQGMTYDASDGNFVLALQGPAQLRVVTLAGSLAKTVSLSQSGSNSFNYLTSVAADANYYYVSDYTCNNGCPDFFRVGKNGGSPSNISSDVQAYGGYPVAIGGSTLYRGSIINNTYDWTNLNQIRISDINTPDSITKTISVAIARGIGDLAWDGTALWVLGYSHDPSPNRQVDLYKIDPSNGATLASYPNVYNPGSPYNPSGLAYANNALYVLNYSESNGVGSTITKIACQ